MTTPEERKAQIEQLKAERERLNELYGGKLSLQAFGTYGLKPGRTMVDEHYERSHWEDHQRGGDERVLELAKRYQDEDEDDDMAAEDVDRIATWMIDRVVGWITQQQEPDESLIEAVMRLAERHPRRVHNVLLAIRLLAFGLSIRGCEQAVQWAVETAKEEGWGPGSGVAYCPEHDLERLLLRMERSFTTAEEPGRLEELDAEAPTCTTRLSRGPGLSGGNGNGSGE